MNLWLAAMLLHTLTGHAWRVIGDVRGMSAVCLVTRHGYDLWANGCFRP